MPADQRVGFDSACLRYTVAILDEQTLGVSLPKEGRMNDQEFAPRRHGRRRPWAPHRFAK
jgi:hypothetical protein